MSRAINNSPGSVGEKVEPRPAPDGQPAAPGNEPPAAGGGARGRSPYLGPAALIVAGVIGLALGIAPLGVPVFVRVLLVVAGLGVCYKGMSNLGVAIYGRDFDLTFWLCTGWLVVLVSAAVFAPLLPLAEHMDMAATLDAPAFAVPFASGEYPLGTNNFGLDLLARVVYGARASLVVGVVAVAIGMLIGGAIGIVAGYFRRGVDTVVGVLTNSLLAVPPLILLIALASVLDPNLRNIAIALSILAIPSMIRLARATTLSVGQREFVLAAHAMGASRWRVMSRELLPNVVLPLMSLAMVFISVLIVAEASLSFLGLGIQPPEPSWGNMIAEGEGGTFQDYPHIVLVPGAALFLTVFAFNVVGEKARQRWDPQKSNA